ncbi:MAG TPA: hypothetical protein VGJ66_02710 [Pyrinomonadaceae bacterium]
MAKYVSRSCPRYNGYLGIVAERKAKLPVEAINGALLRMGLPACVDTDSRQTIVGP